MSSAAGSEFDIQAQYLNHVSSGLQPILAAVAALTDAVETHSVQTVAETLSLLSSSSEQLQTQGDLPTLKQAGTATFRRWLVLLLERPNAGGSLNPPFTVQLPPDEFDARKAWIVEACRAYVKQGVEARDIIAKASQPLLNSQRDLKLLVPVCDEVVTAILVELAKDGKKFEVTLVQPLFAGCDEDAPGHVRLFETHNALPKRLREFGVPVYEVAPQTVAILLQSGTRTVLTSSLLVNADGSACALAGTYQAAILASSSKSPFYMVGEAYKLCSVFTTKEEVSNAATSILSSGRQVPLDVTWPSFITAFLTEKGPVTPQQMSGQYVKTWF